MKVLMTGGGGVLGTALLPLLFDGNQILQLGRRGFSNIPDNDTYRYVSYWDLEELDSALLLKDFAPDIIYHLAAVSTPSSPAIEVWSNTNMTLNLLEACRKLTKQVRFIQASSISVDDNPRSVYACSKLACESLLESYTDLYPNIKGSSVRFPAVVGCGATHGLLPDVIRKIQAEGETMELWGAAPGSTKPYIYAKNLAQAIVGISSEAKFDYYGSFPFTLCTLNAISVKQVAQLVMEELDITKEIVWNKDKTWVGDSRLVGPQPHDMTTFFPDLQTTSSEAIRLAVKDIINDKK